MNLLSLASEETLLTEIKKGNEAAINILINKYARLLWSIASAVLYQVGATEDIEECVADVFIYLWQNAEKYNKEKGKLKVWLSVIARSQAISKYRKLAKNQTISFDDGIFIQNLGIEHNLLQEENKNQLAAAIASLKEAEQEILIRRYYYEQKPKEIALAMDMPVKTIENHLYRAKQKLRGQLKKEVLQNEPTNPPITEK